MIPVSFFATFDRLAENDRRWRERHADDERVASGDVLIFLDPGGSVYLGCFDGAWFAWPAVSGGWRLKRHASESAADGCEEIETPFLVDLALRLTGYRP